MRTLGNLLWFIMGGVLMGLGWWLVGLLAFVSIVGVPWGKACFVIGQFAFWPFGKEAVSREDIPFLKHRNECHLLQSQVRVLNFPKKEISLIDLL